MNRPTSWSAREESLLLLNAYLDDELDAAAVLDIERRMAGDAALRAEYERLRGLKSALATHLSQESASEALRARIEAIGETPKQRPLVARILTSRPNVDWRQMAAAVVLAAVSSAGLTYVAMRPGEGTTEIASAIAGHQRALLAGHPFDVASSDRHTVKPWFDTKLALSPQVLDLAEAGFPLAGGRIDLAGGKPVPVTVYLRRQHVISVMAIPSPGATDDHASPSRATRDGYSVLGWRGKDFNYSAISDLAESELDQFVAQWRRDAAQ